MPLSRYLERSIMAEKRDYYDVLGVNKKASKDEIKSAYRKLAKTYHPDNKETGNETKFKEIQEAYDILYDDNKRATYDQFGHSAFEQAGGNPGGGNPFGGGFGGFSQDDLGDIFSSFFGGGSQRRRSNPSEPRRGNDSVIRIRIDFMDAVLGKDVPLNIDVDETCQFCGGSGAKSPDSIKTCSNCGGHGYVRVQRRSLFGVVESQETCPVCGGKGKIIIDKCPHCGGRGYNHVKKEIKVHIREGINDGQQILVHGMGERGSNGGQPGDLYVEVVIKPHPYFKRDGNDIHLEVPLDFIDAILGTQIEVPTVYGNVMLNVPAGTQPGQILRMKNQGIKDVRTGRPGDQYIHLAIKTPTFLSKEQRNLLESYKKTIKDNDFLYNKFKKNFKI